MKRGNRGGMILILILGIFVSVSHGSSSEKGYQAGPEIHLDAPVYGPAIKDQADPAIAFDGENYFVVWEDEYLNYSHRVIGLRVSPDHEILDPGPILIVDSCGINCVPDIAFDGTDYLVVWEGNEGLGGAWVDPDGEVLDEFVVASQPFWYLFPKVACGQTECLVAWGDDRNGIDGLYATRVAKGGHSLDPDGILIQNALNNPDRPDVAFDGTNYLVTWLDYRYPDFTAIFGARVTSAGEVLEPGGFPIANNLYSWIWPELTYDGTNFVLTWIDFREGTIENCVLVSRIFSSGEVLDPDGFPITPVGIQPSASAIAFDGTNNLVLWTLEGKLYGTRLAPDGTILDPAGFLISDNDYILNPALAAGDNNTLVAWSHDLAKDWIVQSIRVNFTGQVLDPVPVILTEAANDQIYPAASFDGENFLVVWEDYRAAATPGNDDYESDVYGVRIDQNGNILGSAFPICTNTGDQVAPQVAFNGTHYLVTWREYFGGGHAFCSPVTTEGVVLNPEGVLLGSSSVTNSTFSPVASNGDGFMVLLRALIAVPVQVDPAGVVTVGTEVNFYEPQPNYYLYETAMAYDGANYVTLHVRENVFTWDMELVYARVSADGTFLDPDGVVITDEAPYYLAIGGSDEGSFVAYPKGGLIGTRISQDGEILDSPPLVLDSVALAGSDFPSVKSDGTDWTIAWVNETYNPNRIYATKVMADGTVEQEGGSAIAAFDSDTAAPGILPTPSGKTMLTYSRILFDPAFRSNRASTRMIDTSGDLGIDCTQPIDCANGYCVDGVCCDLPCGNSDPGDCQACSVEAGASQDGTCEVISAGWTCRDAVDDCDAAEVCDGQASACPVDEVKPADVVCRQGVTVCDASETCDGISVSCPADEVAPATRMCRSRADLCDAIEYCTGTSIICPINRLEDRGTICRASADDCDAPEECTGFSKQCPDDELYEAGHVCREQARPCDVEEACDGSSASCPADEFEPDGTSCDDALFCNGDDSCEGGTCLHSGNPCLPGESCDENADSCLPADSDDDDASDDDAVDDDDVTDDDMNSDDDSSHSSSDDDDDDKGLCGL